MQSIMERKVQAFLSFLSFRLFLMMYIAQYKFSGHNMNICRLVLVVGCSEKSMTNRINPASPLESNNEMSTQRNLFFVLNSATTIAAINNNNVIKTN